MCIPPPESDEERANQKKNERRKTIKFWVEIASAIILLGYLGVTILIWCATKQAIQSAEKTSRREQRAWLSIKKAQLIPSSSPLGVSTRTGIALYLLNTGKTPAVEKWSRGAINIGSEPPPESSYINPKQTEQSLSIVPVGDVGNWDQIINPTLPNEQISAFYSINKPEETRRLYVHATIHYKDVFGCEHFTEVCMYHRVTDPPDSFAFCDHFNSIDPTTDKECH
jgi:hypothetical protein